MAHICISKRTCHRDISRPPSAPPSHSHFKTLLSGHFALVTHVQEVSPPFEMLSPSDSRFTILYNQTFRPLQYSQADGTVAGHFVPCPLHTLPLRTTKNNRPTSSYHLYLPLCTYHFGLQIHTAFFKCFMSQDRVY